jgi:diguanylate cyclase (GGDEF)-like protein
MALYVVALAFSPLRLQVKELAGLAAFVLLGDLAILAFTWDARLATSSPLVEALRWSALACVLGLTVWAGSLLAALRERVQRSNTGLSHAIETIRHMVTHDELTGVYNRRHLVEVLKAECARSDRYESQWTLCLLDLDFFKRVNDTLGHSGGDLVLRGFAQTIQKAKRPTDTFGRYGGEEFMLILAQTSLESGLRGAERMRALIEATRYEGLGPEFGVSVSIGVAQYRHGEDWQTTIARADRALYRAKQSGRNRVEPEDPPPPDPGQSVRAVARDRREKELLAEPS